MLLSEGLEKRYIRILYIYIFLGGGGGGGGGGRRGGAEGEEGKSDNIDKKKFSCFDFAVIN